MFYVRAVGATGKVTAFEPQKLMYELLTTNVELNRQYTSTLVVAHRAVAGHETRMTSMDGVLGDGATEGAKFEDVASDPSKLVNFGGRSIGLHCT
jgi:hypothetical protein